MIYKVNIFLPADNCVAPLNPVNGAQSGSYEHGGVISFTCDMGYALIGDDVIVCDDGTYNGTSPTCQGNSSEHHCALSCVKCCYV